MGTNATRLMVHTPAELCALLQSREAYEQQIGLKAADGLREFLISPDTSAEFIARIKSNPPPDPWKDGFGVLHLADNIVIGFGGFTGPPGGDGMVELAYGIAPAYQGRGYATETARALMEYAMADKRVRNIRAHTLPEHSASTRVLEKCGFKFVKELTHPVDGLVWRWEIAVGTHESS